MTGVSEGLARGHGRPAKDEYRIVSPTLVGRDGELDQLVTVVSAPPAVAVVEGEAGVGKTRLVEELLTRPELAGCRQLTGRCRKIREPFPLGPVIEAVRGLGAELGGLTMDPVAGALRSLLPELAQWLPAALEPLDDRAAERHRVFRGLLDLLTALALAQPVVLVLEDVHWADAQTREFVGYWLAGPPAALALVLTYRSEEADPEIAALTARLPSLVGHEHVQLTPLDASDTGALAGAILGMETVSAEFASHLRERTGGLPLAVEEVLALAQARGVLVHHSGGWARRSLDELDVPRGIRDPTMQRVAQLPAPAQRVVEAAAVLVVPGELPVLLATAGPLEGPSDATLAVELALGSGLLVEQGELIGFRHVLAAEAVHDSLSGPRRRELHARAAAALQDTSPALLGRIAHHLQHAADAEGWVDAAEAAADQAIAVGDEEEATRLLTEVLASSPLSPVRRAEVAVKLAWAALDTLYASAVIAPLSQAIEEPASEAQRAELRFLLSQALSQAGEDLGRQRRLLADAIPGLDDRPDLLAWAQLAMGIISPPEVPVAEDLAWVNRALEVVARVDDRLLQVFVLGKASSLLAVYGVRTWREIADRVVRITGGAPQQRREANAHYSIGLSACYSGHLLTAERLLTEGLQSAAAQENRRIRMLLRSGLAVLQWFRGTWAGLPEEIAVLLSEMDEYALGRVDVEQVAGYVALARGDLDEAAARFGAATGLVWETAAHEVLPAVAGAAARAAWARGNPADALSSLDVMRDLIEAKGHWPTVCWALPSAVEIWVNAGQLAEASRFVDRAEAGLRELDAPLAPAALCYSRGILTGSADDLVTAAGLYEAVLVPYEAARARERAAGLRFDAGQERAAEVQLKQALAGYDRLGASWDHARAAQLGRRHGVTPARRHAGGRRSYGTALSPQESTVAELAAQGQTNKEIAAKLFISHETVDKHMRSVMRKMGIRSRTELAYRLASGDRVGTGKNGEITP